MHPDASDQRSDRGTWVPDRLAALAVRDDTLWMEQGTAMRMSIFSVQDHYPAGPRTVPQLYGEIVAQAELAERLGYDTFWVAEHHFHEYGVVPNPAVMLVDAGAAHDAAQARHRDLDPHLPQSAHRRRELRHGRRALRRAAGVRRRLRLPRARVRRLRHRSGREARSLRRESRRGQTAARRRARDRARPLPFNRRRAAQCACRCSARCRSTSRSCARRRRTTSAGRATTCCACPMRRSKSFDDIADPDRRVPQGPRRVRLAGRREQRGRDLAHPRGRERRRGAA